MDLQDVQVTNDSRPYVLKLPGTNKEITNDEGKPMTVYVYSYYSDHGTKQQRMIEKKIRTMTLKELSARPENETHAQAAAREQRIKDAQDELTTELIARVTHKFENVQWKGKPVKYSLKEAIAFYKAFPVLQSQVDRFWSRYENFLERSPSD